MFNEMLSKNGKIRFPYKALSEWVENVGVDFLCKRREEAETIFRRLGVTFSVYSEGGDPERLIPFDVVPRIYDAKEWRFLSAGIIQRSRALNAFLFDIYHRGEILRAGIIPRELIYQNKSFVPEMISVDPPNGIYCPVTGIDLVRTGEGEFYVLEDNCRVPSGVSYMLDNREIMMRMFPDLFAKIGVEPVDQYPDGLRKTLIELAPAACEGKPNAVILTPGMHNSAFYEHSYLADQMGVDLVEAQDLFVEDGFVWMRTTLGPKRVDVIYRRIDDPFLDPLFFRSDSLLGVIGLFDAYRRGNVTLCSAPGSGVADDKAVYSFVPKMIEFYLGQKPILKNVPTWRCGKPDECAYVLDNLSKLVVKEVHASGGYGMLIGPATSKVVHAEYAERIRDNPSNFIAQPTLDLSTIDTLCDSALAGRHVDFRPFCLIGKEVRLVPGGLTRVALTEGSLVVNSSQGGGVKDTWVLTDNNFGYR